MRPQLLLVCLTLAVATEAMAQGQPAPSTPPAPTIFSDATTVVARAPSAQPTVVCGMTVIPAPNVDPNGVKPLPQGLFTMRVLEGPNCQPHSQAGVGSGAPVVIEGTEQLRKRLPQFFGPRR